MSPRCPSAILPAGSSGCFALSQRPKEPVHRRISVTGVGRERQAPTQKKVTVSPLSDPVTLNVTDVPLV